MATVPDQDEIHGAVERAAHLTRDSRTLGFMPDMSWRPLPERSIMHSDAVPARARQALRELLQALLDKFFDGLAAT